MASILLSRDGAALGTHGCLVVASTEGPESFRPARVMVDEIARLRRTTHRDRLVYVYVAGERSGTPDADARKIASEVGLHVDAIYGVHEGAGFRASLIRGIVTGIAMISRQRVQPEIADSVRAASELLAMREPTLGGPREIASAIEAVREAARATL